MSAGNRRNRWRLFEPDGQWTSAPPAAPGYFYRRFPGHEGMNVVFFEVVALDGVLTVAGRWIGETVSSLHGYEFCGARARADNGALASQSAKRRAGGATQRWQRIRALKE